MAAVRSPLPTTATPRKGAGIPGRAGGVRGSAAEPPERALAPSPATAVRARMALGEGPTPAS